MIVVRAPLRVTLGGGGTDLPSYYRRHGGFIFALGLDQYVYVMLNRPSVGTAVQVSHLVVETADRAADLEHDLAREALLLHGLEEGVEVSSLADLPDGTGLGSSGTYLVALLAALHEARGGRPSRSALAEEACAIEMEALARPVGKQDPYMAAFGGATVLEIDEGGAVAVRAAAVPEDSLAELVANSHLYYTGVRRSAAEILKEQDAALDGAAGSSSAPTADALHRIKDLGYRILEAVESGDPDGWGRLLHEHWESKKRLSRKVTLSAVDALYDHVRSEYGVLGGKIAGAGGGGFLMLYCPSGHDRLEAFMRSRGMPRLRYGVAREGARVVSNLASPVVAAT